MEARRGCMSLCMLVLYLTITTTSLFTQCDARRSNQPLFKKIKPSDKLKVLTHLDMDPPLMDGLNTQSYSVSSPFSLPPFDSLAPIPLPENTPPYCEYPPLTPQPPSTTIPTPVVYSQPPPPPPPQPYSFTPIFPIQSPPPSPFGNIPGPPEYPVSPNPSGNLPSPPSSIPSPPQYVPSPFVYVPSPPETVPSPSGYVPSPPSYVPGPPEYVPSPGGFAHGPPVFQPPIIHPPPAVPPPPSPVLARWCVAKPSVPEPIIQEAMNYACGSGADCGSIQPNGACFQPDTILAHASFAFNSYWQASKAAGGTCDFGGTAMLVTIDPSFDGCHFIYY